MSKKSVTLERWQWQEIKAILTEARTKEGEKLEALNARTLMTHQTDEAKIEASLSRLSALRAIIAKL